MNALEFGGDVFHLCLGEHGGLDDRGLPPGPGTRSVGGRHRSPRSPVGRPRPRPLRGRPCVLAPLRVCGPFEQGRDVGQRHGRDVKIFFLFFFYLING